ncbi:MAG: ATP-binding cassette domain-containing protein [Pirellulales bacterium]|nr:ATP-binding cassette domain-containing protein [Pirellulales bacterium]
MARLTLQALEKTYPGGTKALDGFDLDVAEGELIAVVGPSGCGKTTLLRLIAGLDRPTAGRILLDGRTLDGVSPRDRNVAMVFQGHALYPHLTAFGNIAFPLKLRGGVRAEIERRVRETARLLGIERLLDRKPRQLSGGEQQRVALGRAIVRDPACFLLDEPLSNLDPRLRDELRRELKVLQRRLRTTTVYVTHDQQEALTLGERVVVMRAGRIQQVGSPSEVYHHPANGFVAGFIGSPGTSFLKGRLVKDAGRLWFEHGAQRLAVAPWAAAELSSQCDTAVVLGVRPDAFLQTPHGGETGNELRAVVESVEFYGDVFHAHLNVEGSILVARMAARRQVAIGSNAVLCVDLDRVHFFEAAPGSEEPGRNLCATLEPRRQQVAHLI